MCKYEEKNVFKYVREYISYFCQVFSMSAIALMFYQIFLSLQVKRCAIITYKHGIYELPYAEVIMGLNMSTVLLDRFSESLLETSLPLPPSNKKKSPPRAMLMSLYRISKPKSKYQMGIANFFNNKRFC